MICYEAVISAVLTPKPQDTVSQNAVTACYLGDHLSDYLFTPVAGQSMVRGVQQCDRGHEGLCGEEASVHI